MPGLGTILPLFGPGVSKLMLNIVALEYTSDICCKFLLVFCHPDDAHTGVFRTAYHRLKHLELQFHDRQSEWLIPLLSAISAKNLSTLVLTHQLQCIGRERALKHWKTKILIDDLISRNSIFVLRSMTLRFTFVRGEAVDTNECWSRPLRALLHRCSQQGIVDVELRDGESYLGVRISQPAYEILEKLNCLCAFRL